MPWLLIGVGIGIGLFVGVLLLLFILHLVDDWLTRQPVDLAVQQRHESTAATPSVPRSPVGT